MADWHSSGKVAVGGGFNTSRSRIGAQQSRATANDTWAVAAVAHVSTNSNRTVPAHVIRVDQERNPDHNAGREGPAGMRAPRHSVGPGKGDAAVT